MIVFDVDGTLLGGESTDWASFNAAIEEVAGFSPDDIFFSGIQEITAQAIAFAALKSFPAHERKEKEALIRASFLKRLEAAHALDPLCFPATHGAAELLLDLRKNGISVAIATGDWRETISFKLRAAGLPVDDIPMVTSSEFYSRSDIIAAAVAMAGKSLNEAIYVGDGVWDLNACRKLGIPFIGVGNKAERLKIAGASHHLPNLMPSEFWPAKNALRPVSNFS